MADALISELQRSELEQRPAFNSAQHRGLVCVTYLSHFAKFLWDLGLLHLPIWRPSVVTKLLTLNTCGKIWGYWRMRNTDHPNGWDLRGSDFLEFNSLLSLWRWQEGKNRKPDTLGSCQNFTGAFRVVFGAIKLLIQFKKKDIVPLWLERKMQPLRWLIYNQRMTGVPGEMSRILPRA